MLLTALEMSKDYTNKTDNVVPCFTLVCLFIVGVHVSAAAALVGGGGVSSDGTFRGGRTDKIFISCSNCNVISVDQETSH